jgi:hypothetical protein
MGKILDKYRQNYQIIWLHYLSYNFLFSLMGRILEKLKNNLTLMP